jgi:hypothetical protein
MPFITKMKLTYFNDLIRASKKRKRIGTFKPKNCP